MAIFLISPELSRRWWRVASASIKVYSYMIGAWVRRDNRSSKWGRWTYWSRVGLLIMQDVHYCTDARCALWLVYFWTSNKLADNNCFETKQVPNYKFNSDLIGLAVFNIIDDNQFDEQWNKVPCQYNYSQWRFHEEFYDINYLIISYLMLT